MRAVPADQLPDQDRPRAWWGRGSWPVLRWQRSYPPKCARITARQLEAAWRHAAEAHAAAVKMLASSAEAFRRAADAHERVASVHERAAASGIGDVRMRERQAALHRAAAAADRLRAERAQLLLSNHERAWLTAVSDEPGGGVAR